MLSTGQNQKEAEEIIGKFQVTSVESWLAVREFAASNGVQSLLQAGLFKKIIQAKLDSDDSQDAAKSLLNAIFNSCSATELFSFFGDDLSVGLQNANNFLKSRLLIELREFLKREPTAVSHLAANDSLILTTSLSLFVVEELSLSRDAFEFLKVCATIQPLLFVDSKTVADKLIAFSAAKLSTQRCRAYEFTALLCTISPEALVACSKLGLLDQLLSELSSTDILAQLTCLELLADMTSSSIHVAQFFHQHGIIKSLYDMLLTSQHAPDANFLFPAIMKFFGYLARVHPKDSLETYPQFLSSIFDLVRMFDRLDVAQRLLAFDTLGLVASTSEGKIVLEKHEKIMKECMHRFGEAIQNGPEELKVRHLEALIDLVHLEPSDLGSERLLSLVERWFQALTPPAGSRETAAGILFRLFQQPIKSIHCTSGEVIKQIAYQAWGQKALARTPGFIEYLLNRETEHDMEGRHIKYEIVCALLSSEPTIGNAFSPDEVARLKRYQREGAFYVKAGEAQVALEGGGGSD